MWGWMWSMLSRECWLRRDPLLQIVSRWEFAPPSGQANAVDARLAPGDCYDQQTRPAQKFS